MPARMPDRRRHGADEDRIPVSVAAPPRRAVARSADRVSAALGAVRIVGRSAAQPARSASGPAASLRAGDRGLREAIAAALALRHVLSRLRGNRRLRPRAGRCRAFRRHVHEQLRAGKRARGAARAARGGLSRRRRATAREGGIARPSVVLRPNVSRLRARRRSEARSVARRRRARTVRGRGCRDRRARAVVPAVAARRVPGAWSRRSPPRGSPSAHG